MRSREPSGASQPDDVAWALEPEDLSWAQPEDLSWVAADEPPHARPAEWDTDDRDHASPRWLSAGRDRVLHGRVPLVQLGRTDVVVRVECLDEVKSESGVPVRI